MPFVEESFYKAWGPIAIALDAARHDPAYLAVMPLYFLAFRPQLRLEWQRLRATAAVLPVPVRRSTASAAHSSGEG